jgi:hypothetical protein
MPRVDVIDEAVIDRPPAIVYMAILNEYAGVTHWMPTLEFKPKVERSFDCVGAVCDVTAHSHGMAAHFSVKMTKLVKEKLIEFELAGDLLGTETWTLEPLDGKTKVQLRWNGKTNRLLLSLFAPFVNPEKEHSAAIQKGLKSCNSYLCKK